MLLPPRDSTLESDPCRISSCGHVLSLMPTRWMRPTQVLDSTLPTAHVISASYRPSAPAPSQSASTRHVGYLPQVDDMLGMHPGDMPGQAQSAAPAEAAIDGSQNAGSDPFVASSEALQMRSASMAASMEREGHSGRISSSSLTGELMLCNLCFGTCLYAGKRSCSADMAAAVPQDSHTNYRSKVWKGQGYDRLL